MKKYYFLNFIFILLFVSFSKFGYAAEPPYLAPISDQTAVIGQLFTLDINAINAVPAETYELTVARPGMTIDPVTGIISWTPADIADGGMVTVRAFNSEGESERSFTIYLSDAITCPAELLSYWKLDAITQSGVYTDFAGGFDATTTLALTDTTGIVDGAQIFRPTTKLNRFLTVPDSSEHTWARSGSFSFSFWFLYEGNKLNSNQVLIGKGFSGSGFSMILVSLDNSGPSPKVKYELKNVNASSGEIAALTGTTNIQTNQWYHVTAVYQGDVSPNPVTMRLYVNGVKSVKTVGNFDASGFTKNSKLNIGYWNAYVTTNTYPFNGVIDEVSLFNRALSDDDVAGMETSGMNGLPLCRPGNYAPQFTSSPVLTATQDAAYTYTATAEDYEMDGLTLSAEILPSWLSFVPGTGVLSGMPGNDNVGDTIVDIMVTDGALEIHQQFTISVANVNDPPEITSVPENTEINEGETFSYTFTAMDIDPGDHVTLSAPVLPSWMTFDPVTGLLEGTPTNDQVLFAADSVFDVQLKVTDDSNEEVTQDFTVTVINVNDPPQVTGQASLATDRNVALDISISDLTVVDPDNYPSELVFTILDGDNYSVAGNTVTPDMNFYGDLTVLTQIGDGTDVVDYDMAVTVNFINIAPEFTSSPVTGATEGVAYTYLVKASDADVGDPNQNQTLTFWAETLPSWLTFTLVDNVLVGIPGNGDVGESNVSIGVSDGTATVYQTFVIVVDNINDPPVITGQQDITGIKNSNITITAGDLVIDDPDNVPADMTVIILDGDNYTHDGNTVTFAQDFLGELTVNVKVNDGSTDSNIFQITISVEPGDGIPTLTADFVGRVYPNPSSDFVVFELNASQHLMIEVRNLTGKVMMLQKLENGMNEYRLDVSGFAKGVYIYRVYDNDHYQIGKLLVE